MSNILNDDFVDFLNALKECNVEYILVGGYAVIYHGYNRTTGDLDVWVNPTNENYRKLILAFNKFGLSLFDMTEELFLVNKELNVFTFGRPPVCIDLLTRLKGLNFDEVYPSSYQTEFSGVDVRMIDLLDLIRAKKASNRPKDIDDINHIS
jgi:predicted nucleotidyltransferase